MSLKTKNTQIFNFDPTEFYSLGTVINSDSPNAYYLQRPQFETVVANNFIGDVSKGGSCNVQNIIISPHGNGTHTECCGHISKERHFISQCKIPPLMNGVFIEGVIQNDNSVTADLGFLKSYNFPSVQAALIRCYRDSSGFESKDWSGTNPLYFDYKLIEELVSLGIEHFITDLPSVDSEDSKDLKNHHTIFRDEDGGWFTNRTITEMALIPNNFSARYFVLNLQISLMDTDAVPSRPIIFPARTINR